MPRAGGFARSGQSSAHGDTAAVLEWDPQPALRARSRRFGEGGIGGIKSMATGTAGSAYSCPTAWSIISLTLQTNWKGWEGSQRWSSLEGELSLEARARNSSNPTPSPASRERLPLCRPNAHLGGRITRAGHRRVRGVIPRRGRDHAIASQRCALLQPYCNGKASRRLALMSKRLATN